MIDFDYKEKESEHSVMYVIGIENFRTKLETVRVGQVASSKRFFIKESKLRIDLYFPLPKYELKHAKRKVFPR